MEAASGSTQKQRFERLMLALGAVAIALLATVARSLSADST
jgi:hypothetical protein